MRVYMWLFVGDLLVMDSLVANTPSGSVAGRGWLLEMLAKEDCCRRAPFFFFRFLLFCFKP